MEKISGRQAEGTGHRGEDAFEKVVGPRGLEGLDHDKDGQDIREDADDDVDALFGAGDKGLVDRRLSGKAVGHGEKDKKRDDVLKGNL